MQKNAILLGGPAHGRVVPFAGYNFLWRTRATRRDSVVMHEYLWEYRGGEYLGPSPGTIFGVYQKPREKS